jgi:hypothetical protein
MKRTTLLIIAIAAFLVPSPLRAQVYSYLDENGIRVFTNIAPTGPVQDLKVSGRPPEPAPVKKPGPAKLKTGVSAQKPNSSKGSAQAKADPDGYDAIINKYAAEFSLDPKLLRAMIVTESGYNPDAVSPKGAQGLMQLMPATAARLGVGNPFDPEENIWGGARYMRFLLDTFAEPAEDALILSLAAYNAGENLVQGLGRVPNIRETNEYVSSIIQRYGKRVMEAPPPVVQANYAPRTFQYFDEKGILILTNIPPIDRSRTGSQTGGSNLISR